MLTIPSSVELWEDIMVDYDGPLQPPGLEGDIYVLTYLCCFCGGVFLEPLARLHSRSAWRAFANCMFRSGCLPSIIRSDRRPEFDNSIFREFVNVIGMTHKFGMPYRPVQQGKVERIL